MNKALLSLIVGLGMGFLPVSVYSSCLKKVALGEYHLGEWSNADGTVVISAIVGSITRRVNGNNLERLRDNYIRQCDRKAKRLIKRGKKLFPEQAEDLEEWFLDNAEDCKQMFRDNYEHLKPVMC